MTGEVAAASAEDYEWVLRDLVSDRMAEGGIPQRFWPPQVVHPSTAAALPAEPSR